MQTTSLYMQLLLVVIEYVVGQPTLTYDVGMNCGTDLSMKCQVNDSTYDSTTGRIWSHPAGTDIISNGLSIDGNKYTEDLSTGPASDYFSMTILGVDIDDAGIYICTYDFDPDSTTLGYECYNSTSLVAVCTDNKITITVDRVYPPTTTLNVTDSGGNAVPGAIASTGSTTYANHFILTWTSSNTVPGGNYTYSVGITTSSGGAEASLATTDPVTCETKDDGGDGGCSVICIVVIVVVVGVLVTVIIVVLVCKMTSCWKQCLGCCCCQLCLVYCCCQLCPDCCQCYLEKVVITEGDSTEGDTGNKRGGSSSTGGQDTEAQRGRKSKKISAHDPETKDPSNHKRKKHDHHTLPRPLPTLEKSGAEQTRGISANFGNAGTIPDVEANPHKLPPIQRGEADGTEGHDSNRSERKKKKKKKRRSDENEHL